MYSTFQQHVTAVVKYPYSLILKENKYYISGSVIMFGKFKVSGLGPGNVENALRNILIQKSSWTCNFQFYHIFVTCQLDFNHILIKIERWID